MKGGKAITLVDDYANNWEYVTNQGTRFTFLTNKDAPRQRLVSLDIRKPAALTQIVGEQEGTLVGASRVGDRIIPVSDTHLDVYKRQGYGNPLAVFDQAAQLEKNFAASSQGATFDIFVGV